MKILICPSAGEDEENNCQIEHNPLEGYEDHHYGCDCDGCVQWYWLLKN